MTKEKELEWDKKMLKMDAEIANLNATTGKLNQETSKLLRETQWYPAIVASTAALAGVAIAKLFL